MTLTASELRAADIDRQRHPLLAYRADRMPWHIVLPLELLVPYATGVSIAHDGSTAPHAATLTLAGFAART